MISSLKPVPRPAVVLPIPQNKALSRTRAMAAQFPAPTGPTVAVITIAVVVLAITTAMFLFALSRQEVEPSAAPVAASEEPAPTAEEDASTDVAAVAPVQPASLAPVEPSEEMAAAEQAPARPQATRVGVPLSGSVLTPLDGSNATSSTVAVAETTEELLALEEIQRREVEADLATPSNEITAAIQPDTPQKVSARATAWVNMRAGPADEAEVLMVVPGNAEIQAETDCGWCAVSYDGRDGYIYKSFISYQ